MPERGGAASPDLQANADGGIFTDDVAPGPADRNPFPAAAAVDARVVPKDAGPDRPLFGPDGAGRNVWAPSEADPSDGGLLSSDVSARGDACDAVEVNVEEPACREDCVTSVLSPSSLRTESWARVVAVADLDTDGNLDIVTANSAGNMVSVLLGNGDGAFERPMDDACGKRPEGMAVEDANDNGDLDIVTANAVASTVSMLLGRGTGTFARQVAYATGGILDRWRSVTSPATAISTS